jgi:hypothetical protein
MTRDEIAKVMNDSAGAEWGTEAHFQRFAALIAAQRDADKANQPYSYDGLVMFPPGTLAELIRRERAKEREECAKVCEAITWSDEGKFFARAIRERSET